MKRITGYQSNPDFFVSVCLTKITGKKIYGIDVPLNLFEFKKNIVQPSL